MKTYVVKLATVVEGSPARPGDILSKLTEDEAKPYLANGSIEESPNDEEGERIDAAPSDLPPLATQTKRAAVAEKSADKKAANAEEK